MVVAEESTSRGVIKLVKLASGQGHSWMVDGRHVEHSFAKAMFPVEYHLILANRLAKRTEGRSNGIAKKLSIKASEAIADVMRDAECEIRWGARNKPIQGQEK